MSLMTTTSTMAGAPLIEIDNGSEIYAITFAANGEYLLSGGNGLVRAWRVKDGKPMAEMEADSERVTSLTTSNDGKWIVAGTYLDIMFMWDAETYEKVSAHWPVGVSAAAVDFSPDSTRLVCTSDCRVATVRNVRNCEEVLALVHAWHGDSLIAGKYSPQGDRMATAGLNGIIQIWDSNGRLLVYISEVTVIPWYNSGLLWFNNNLFVVSDGKIQEVDGSTGSVLSEWPVPDTTPSSCIALPKHGQFIAYATKRTVTFWDMMTRTQLAFIQHPQDISSIAFSPDDRLLAISGIGGKISIMRLSRATNDSGPTSNATRHDDVPTGHAISTLCFGEWAKATLANQSWKDALLAAADSGIPRATTYKALCERLETVDRITDAVECFHQMTDEFGGEMTQRGEHLEWTDDFCRRSSKKLEGLGDTAVDAQRYDEAISHFTTALSLDLPPTQGVLIKRSRAFIATGSWQQALDDANQVIVLDPSSPWGYEMKQAALQKVGDYDNAVGSLEVTLSKITKSPDLDIQRPQ